MNFSSSRYAMKFIPSSTLSQGWKSELLLSSARIGLCLELCERLHLVYDFGRARLQAEVSQVVFHSLRAQTKFPVDTGQFQLCGRIIRGVSKARFQTLHTNMKRADVLETC